ncbi:hypothetical protein Fcan01_10627 [Folsomia candida]|uniref:Protein quiver n=1 Tax=Folsomia candida TaxID=158441 RepID=A0A226E829_FOLCA|nr:hypothetical protein Fcan01_10627 [Folsomia candida]
MESKYSKHFTVIIDDSAVPSDNRDGTLKIKKVLCGMGRRGRENASSIVVRGCGLVDSSYDNTCSKKFTWVVRNPEGVELIKFPANTDRALNTCFCSSNHCNGATVMEVMFGLVVMCVLLSGFFG